LQLLEPKKVAPDAKKVAPNAKKLLSTIGTCLAELPH
jgi:hypothetical protein